MWEVFLTNCNGISLFLKSEQTPSLSLQLFTNAAGSIGFGGYLEGQWFHSHWLPEQEIIKTTGISIAWQELYPIYLACCLWGSQWATKCIVFFRDNESVVQILNQKTSKCPKIMDLLGPITGSFARCDTTLRSQQKMYAASTMALLICSLVFSWITSNN